MARDYKSRAQHRPQKKPIPVFVWLLTGYLLGAISVGMLWLNWSPDGNVPGWINQDTPLTVESAPENDAPEAEPVAPPRFDFYTLLPEMEIVVPEDELEAETRPAASPPAPAATETTTAQPTGPGYLLQVGSFRNAADADRVKAKLTIQGYATNVSHVKTGDGNKWSRVRVGPIHSAEALKAQRKQLESQGYKSLVIRVKQ